MTKRAMNARWLGQEMPSGMRRGERGNMRIPFVERAVSTAPPLSVSDALLTLDAR
jgi:hypothetical protein